MELHVFLSLHKAQKSHKLAFGPEDHVKVGNTHITVAWYIEIEFSESCFSHDSPVTPVPRPVRSMQCLQSKDDEFTEALPAGHCFNFLGTYIDFLAGYALHMKLVAKKFTLLQFLGPHSKTHPHQGPPPDVVYVAQKRIERI